MSAIRFNVADAQRSLASALKVAGAVNRVALEPSFSYVQNPTAGERMALRVERGVYVFDVKFENGASGAMTLDSGAEVKVWPKDRWNDAKIE